MDWIQKTACSLHGVTHDYKEEWGSERYFLAGKTFAMHGTDNKGRPILTLKLEPALSTLLRNEHRSVVPGYYMNKEHWSSFYLDEGLPQSFIETCIHESYACIKATLTKKQQALLDL